MVIRISRSADTRTHTVVSITKTGEERTVGIRDRTVAILKAQRQLEERMAAGASGWADPGLVFPNTVGKIRRRDVVVRNLKRFLEEAGLPPEVCFHDLRHTATTQAIHKGAPIH